MQLSLKGLQTFVARSYGAKVRRCYAASVFMESLPPDPPKRKLLDQVRDAIRLKHYSYRTEQTYAAWIRRYIFFHNKRHPKDMGSPEVETFLAHFAVTENVATSTQNQALSALLFLYRYVLQQPLEDNIDAIRANGEVVRRRIALNTHR